MRRVYQFSSPFEPSYFFSIPPVASGSDQLIAVNSNFSSVYQVVNTTLTDVTPTGISPIASTEPFTHTFLGGVAYLNRVTHVPYQRRPADSIFTPLSNWTSTWRCSALRSYKDFLIALNVTKGSTSYPTMVKWSDVAQFGNPPPSWDATLTTNSAGENIVNEMRGAIIDGLSLRDSFIIYCADEVWIMDYIGGNFLFRFRKLFNSTGIVNQNCVTQVDGVHYVFGPEDIWLHDGASKKSICHGKTKDFIFEGMDNRYADLSFVSQDPSLNEIHFCYVSRDRLVGFRNASVGCNRAAVYNYRNDTWSFYDLPNVTASTVATLSTGETYASIGTTTFDDIGGSYLAAVDDSIEHTLFAGRSDATLGLSTARIYGMDKIIGGRLVKPIDPETVKPSFLERVGIDLDEEGVGLTTYKVIQALYPQVGVLGDQSVSFQFGATDIIGQEPLWGPQIPYSPTIDNKIDSREAGRYLGYRMYYAGQGDFSLSGFDGKITTRGRR